MYKLLCFLVFLSISMISCVAENEDGCQSNADCPDYYTCNLETNKCVSEKGNGEEKDDKTGEKDDSSEVPDEGGEVPDKDSGIITHCEPGMTIECYTGPSGTKGVGICKAGISTCLPDGYAWSGCEGEVTPQPEICGDGIDQNCDGKDWTEDMAYDIDGDGYTYCDGDCCEVIYECWGQEPEKINPGAFDFPANGVDENCDGTIDSERVLCDSNLSADSKDPVDLAKAIGLCPAPADDPKGFGLLSAEISFPDGTGVGAVPENQYSVLPKFGNSIVPNLGNFFAAMSTGNASDPIGESSVNNETSSGSPQDWYSANGNKYPTPPDCGFLTQNSKDPANDPVMLKLKIRAPTNAEAFSFDIYFFSIEFHEYVCSQYNDFFVALLDSKFFSGDPNLANPIDKNLAMDGNGNPVGINLAMSGLFTVCDKAPLVAPQKTKYCEGSEELKGTGFDKNGATGWLTTRGNIEPGEEFELRLAIWDAGDHVLDSMVVFDNWQWYPTRQKPGTDRK